MFHVLLPRSWLRQILGHGRLLVVVLLILFGVAGWQEAHIAILPSTAAPARAAARSSPGPVTYVPILALVLTLILVLIAVAGRQHPDGGALTTCGKHPPALSISSCITTIES